MTRQTVRTMLRATASGAQRWYHVIFAEQPVPEPLFLEQVVGARVGATVDRPEVGLVASELVLPRPLEVGETAIIETSTRLVDLGGPDTTYFHHIDRRMSEVVIWVRFDAAALPTRCVQTVQAMEEPAVETPVHLGRARHRPRGGAVVRTGQRRAHLGVVSREVGSAAVRREVWSAVLSRAHRSRHERAARRPPVACSRRRRSSRARGSPRYCEPRRSAACCSCWARSPRSCGRTRPGRRRTRPCSDFAVVPHALHLHLSLEAWAADGLLAIFFFVAGLELKREFVAGELRDPRRAALPVAAAVGGMIVPALVYVAVNAGDEHAEWLGDPDRDRHRVRGGRARA